MAKTYALPDESLHTIYALCAFESATTVLGLMIGPYPMLLGIGQVVGIGVNRVSSTSMKILSPLLLNAPMI